MLIKFFLNIYTVTKQVEIKNKHILPYDCVNSVET